MFLPGIPRDKEEQRLRGGTIAPFARDAEEKRLRPDLAIATPLQRARDAEEVRHPGSKPPGL
jgi:hypothetical protein